jgi:hypothetical protein
LEGASKMKSSPIDMPEHVIRAVCLEVAGKSSFFGRGACFSGVSFGDELCAEKLGMDRYRNSTWNN